MKTRHLTNLKKFFMMINNRWEHVYENFFRITAAGDDRITADGNTRITANSDY